MVMRKFKKSVDNSEPDLHNPEIGLNSPRLSRKNRGGSFSGPSLQDSGDMGVNSPASRRRRSRIPSEEDDQLINFLVTGSSQESKEGHQQNLAKVKFTNTPAQKLRFLFKKAQHKSLRLPES